MEEKKIQSAYPLTIGHQFITAMNHEAEQAVMIAIKQRKIIERFAAQGSCIIVGRSADIILEKYSPFNIFVYANREVKSQHMLMNGSSRNRCKPIDKMAHHIENVSSQSYILGNTELQEMSAWEK